MSARQVRPLTEQVVFTLEEIALAVQIVAAVDPKTLSGTDPDELTALVYKCRAAAKDDGFKVRLS